MSTPIQHFHVQLFQRHSDGKTNPYATFDEQGDSEAPLPQYIVVDGFSHDHIIELKPYWDKLISQGMQNYETTVTVRETIIKFGDTMQLVDDYILKFNITYAVKNELK